MLTQRFSAATALLAMYGQSELLASQMLIWVREAQEGSFESLSRLWRLIPVRFIRGIFQLATQLHQRRATVGDDIISQPARLRQVLSNVIANPDSWGLIIPPEEMLPVPEVVRPLMGELPGAAVQVQIDRLPSVMLIAEQPRSPPPMVVQEALQHLAERREERVLEFRRQEMKRLELASIKARQEKITARKAKEQPRSSPD